MNNSTKNLFQDFESEVIATTQLPFCQVQNPPNMSLAQIQEYQPHIGWFIPFEQAELAHFDATDDWQLTRLTFGEESMNPREVDGFLAVRLRISILHTSSIEVQEKASRGWQYLGQAYQYGRLTNHGELAKSDRENYRLRTRYLILCLDEDNQPLHSVPFKIGMNAGVGAAFGTEVKEFRQDIETAFFQSIEQPKKSLSDRAHALTVFDFCLGCHKSESKAPYIYPQIRSTPAENQVVQRRSRQVNLKNQPLESLIIPKMSETGQIIFNFIQEYRDVFQRNSDDLANVEDSPLVF